MNTQYTVLQPAQVTAMLRTGALAICPQDIGLEEQDCPPVWGVLMETGVSSCVLSLLVLADGSVSIYASDGSGVLGAGLHPEIRHMASTLLSRAKLLVSSCVATQHFPLPAAGKIRFYFLTRTGVCTAEMLQVQLEHKQQKFAALYRTGRALMDAIELLDAGHDLVDEMCASETH